MTMDNEKAIDEINSLIEINNDRIEGYQKASEETKDSDLKNLFSRFISTSEHCRTELVSEVRNLGGEPAEGTKTTGKLYRVFMDMKAALSGNDRKTILDSCEAGEDTAVEAYEDALENMEDESDGFTAEQKNMVTAQYEKIKADHDMVRSMRDALVED